MSAGLEGGGVSLTSVAPGALAHFAADTAIQGQQDEGQRDRRVSSLWEPVDDDRDAGTRGPFGAEAHGVATAGFLRQLPRTALGLVGGLVASLGDQVHQVRTHVGSPS